MPTTGYRIRSRVPVLRGRGDSTIYARANPEKVKITETYEVEQNISVNPGIDKGAKPPTGKIEVTVPFDGERYFTRQAIKDVERAIPGSPPGMVHDVVTGRLLLAGHDSAALPVGTQMRGQYGAIPVTVPVTSAEISDGALAADRQACVIAHDYQPKFPEIIPARLDIKVDDPDTLDFMSMVDMLAESDWEDAYYTRAIADLRQKVSFKNMLMMNVGVSLMLPHDRRPGSVPVLRRFSIDWPTITSLNTTTLEVDVSAEDDKEPSWQVAPVRYNPVERRLEWEKIKMKEDQGGAGGGRARTLDYECPPMQLLIEHPGELYRTPELKVRAQIEIPGYLMSGLEPRFFNVFGREQNSRLKMSTRINVTGTLVVDDAFARRSFSPYHQFVFDDIVPDDMRISDIRNVLKSLRFEVPPAWSDRDDPEAGFDPDAPNWFLRATRSQGPDQMELRISVEGARHVLNRKQTMGDKTVQTTGSRKSGQIRLYVQGRLPRDHQEVTREMNALQKALRDRYRPHQDSRK